MFYSILGGEAVTVEHGGVQCLCTLAAPFRSVSLTRSLNAALPPRKLSKPWRVAHGWRGSRTLSADGVQFFPLALIAAVWRALDGGFLAPDPTAHGARRTARTRVPIVAAAPGSRPGCTLPTAEQSTDPGCRKYLNLRERLPHLGRFPSGTRKEHR